MKLSIIVPVYNVVNYLEKCLASVFSQNFNDYEIVLVDDGSTDGSGELCDKFSESNEKIKVIHQANQGLSAARNNGIRHSQGEYFILLDSDDWLLNDTAFEVISKKFDSDVIMFDMSEYRNNKRIDLKLTEGLKQSYMQGTLFLEDALRINPHFRWYACIYAYRRQFWIDNNLEYPVGYKYEDLGTTYKVLLSAGKVSVINESLYAYRRLRNDSITSNVTLKSLSDKLELQLKFLENFEKADIPETLKKSARLSASFVFYELLIRTNSMSSLKERRTFLERLNSCKNLSRYAASYSNKYAVSYLLLKLFGVNTLGKIYGYRELLKH